MQAVILCGGLGTRLAQVTGGLPKALTPVGGQVLLHMQLALLARHGFTDVLLLVRYGADQIRSACGDGSAWGISIRYVEETEPRGTGGAVLRARPYLADVFVVVYGDTVLDVDLSRMWKAHRYSGADVTMFVHPNDHPHDSDIVEADPTGRIVALHPYPHPAGLDLPNSVSAALYVVAQRCLDDVVPWVVPFDFCKHLFPLLLERGKVLHAYRSREYIKDAGDPSRLAQADADVRSGLVASRSSKFPVPAIFFDRDGTLVDDPGHIAHADQLMLLPGAAAAVQRANRSVYVSALVTNQPVVARGLIDEPGLRRIHNRLEQLLGREGAYLDAIYYCPHHPETGFPGERADYKIICDCRKPSAGMLRRAAQEMNIDLRRSWLIGDSHDDVETAKRAEVLSARVVNHAGKGRRRFARRPDFEFATVGQAVDFILDAWPALARRANEVVGQIEPGSLVAIGGLARAGKSAFASALAWALRSSYGIAATVISLDGWIRPPDAKEDLTARFNLDAMQAQISAAIGDPTVYLHAPLRARSNDAPNEHEAVRIASTDVVIVEGLAGLIAKFDSSRPQVRIHVSRDEAARREIVRGDALEGSSDRQLHSDVAGQSIDEIRYLTAAGSSASLLVATV